MKKILSMSLLVIDILLSACGSNEAAKKITPADDVSVFCNAILHFDCNSLQKIGMTLEEYEQSFIDGFGQSLVKSSGIAFSDEQVKRINDAVIDVLKRTQFNVETVSENGGNAKVKITTDTLEQFNETLLMSRISANISSMSDTEKIDAFANAMADALKNLKKVDQTEFLIDCRYDEENKMWVPVQLENFADVLFSKVFKF